MIHPIPSYPHIFLLSALSFAQPGGGCGQRHGATTAAGGGGPGDGQGAP